jgi:hypothetical protein
MSSDDGQQPVSLQELTSRRIPVSIRSRSVSFRVECKLYCHELATHVKKYEQPRTWLCKNGSLVFSDPNSSNGSAQSMSHISPCVGGSLNRLICKFSAQADHQHNGTTWIGNPPARTLRISSKVLSSGDSPPWIQRNCLFITAARGKLQNESIQAL